MNRYIYLLSVLSLLIYSCSIEEPNFNPNAPSGISLESDDHIILPFYENDSTIHFYVDGNIDLTDLTLNARFSPDTVVHFNNDVFNGVINADFSDFVHPHHISLYVAKNRLSDKKVIIYNLPVLKIDTPESVPITSKDERVKGCIVSMYYNDTVEDYGEAGIKLRGNSTLALPKKPFNVKFDKKHSILGMENSKHYTLLANAYYDRTQLHNATAFEIARCTDFPYVQKGEFVELILNGIHQGLYYLCEKPRVSEGRINITEMKEDDTTGINITGGYLLESETTSGSVPESSLYSEYFNHTGANFAWKLFWNIESPEDITPGQRAYIQHKLNHMEYMIYNRDSLISGVYRNYFDIETAINWYLVQELTLNEEASRTKNVFLYKERGSEKFYVGPPWDFDAWTFGVLGTHKFYCNTTSLYFSQLFNDPFFVNRLKEKWNLLKQQVQNNIPEFINTQYEKIYLSALRNDAMWPDWWEFFNPKEKSYEQTVEDMINAFNAQLNWMDEQINSL